MPVFGSPLMSLGLLLVGLALGLSTSFVPVRRGWMRPKRAVSSPPPPKTTVAPAPPSPSATSTLHSPLPVDVEPETYVSHWPGSDIY